MTYRLGILVILGLLLELSGCATVGSLSGNKAHQNPQLQSLLSGEKLFEQPISLAELPTDDLLAVTPEMVAFAKKAVSGKDSDFEKVSALHFSLLKQASAGGHGIHYSRYATSAPITTFNKRQANCLSYALLFRALARAVGLSAYINDVQVPPTWDMRDDESMVFLRHVNVKVRLRSGRSLIKMRDEVVIDLEMTNFKAYYHQSEISDASAAAQFFSNRALELSQEKQRRLAFIYLRKAIELDGQQSYLWNNFASLYLRANLIDDAVAIYQHALALNPKDLSVINNLANVYTKLNRLDEAETYRKIAEKHRESNPYFQYFNAYKAFDKEEYDTALTLVRRSIKLDEREPRFYDLANKIYLKLGRINEAKAMQKKYNTLTTSLSLL